MSDEDAAISFKVVPKIASIILVLVGTDTVSMMSFPI